MKNVKLTRFLIDQGADVNTKNDKGFTLLHDAASRHIVELVQLLLERGVDVNAKDLNGMTPR